MKKAFVVLIIVLLSLAIFAGCAPFKGTGINDGRSYELNQSIEISTGSAMVSAASKGRHYITFEPLFIQESSFGTFMPGQVWIAFSVLKSDNDKYVLTSTQFHNEDVGIIVNQNGEVIDDQPIIANMKKRPFREPWTRRIFPNLKNAKLFARKSFFLRAEGDFRAELLYGGVINNTITLTYREFFKDFARPAFYQEMKYDLNATDVIVFRTIKMKVLSASNLKIVFQVLEDGGLPWIFRH